MTRDSVSYTRREIAGVAVATSRFPNAVDEIEDKSNCQLFIIRCTSVTLNKTELSLAVGGSGTLTATVSPNNATNQTVTWTSSKPAVATVDKNGTVTAVAEGECIITAKAGEKTATCTVLVTAASQGAIPATGITLIDDEELELEAGKPYVLSAFLIPQNTTDDAEWENSDPYVVSANVMSGSNPGVTACYVVALKVGTCTLTVKAGNASASYSITVVQPDSADDDEVTSVTFKKKEIVLKPDGKTAVEAIIDPEWTGKKVTWTSSDESVAVVAASTGYDRTADITAKKEGAATITAECGGKKASVLVSVLAEDSEEIKDTSGGLYVYGFKKESDDLVYTGKQVTQDIQVYYKGTLLKEKTDYTVKYQNKINAAEYDSDKAPSLTIALKGQYSGSVTLYYTISRKDINDEDIVNIYKGKLQAALDFNNIPAPELIYGKTKLKAGKDFTYNKAVGNDGVCTVEGIGNFDKKFEIKYKAVDDKNKDFASASVKLKGKQYLYDGEKVGLPKTDIEVKLAGTPLAQTEFDHEINIDGAYVLVYPSAAGNTKEYYGCKKVSFKLAGDREIKDAKTADAWKATIPFSQEIVNNEGGIFQTAEKLLQYNNEPLVEGRDYTIKYSNAVKVGNVTVTFTGKGRYKGTNKQTYAIVPNSKLVLDWNNVTNGKIRYQKGGAVPDFTLTAPDGTILKNKTDYTVALRNNKKPGDTMTCIITGKGNYKGYNSDPQEIYVEKGNLNDAAMAVSDMLSSDKPNKWKAKVTVIDSNGKKLSAGRDYGEPVYTYEAAGKDIVITDPQLPEGVQEIKATVVGKGDYEGTNAEKSEISAYYHVYQTNISSLKVKIDDQEYTGEAIKLTEKVNVHVYKNSEDMAKGQNQLGKDEYEIVEGSFQNNINAGTAKVTLRGKGTYGGEKTYTFKIKKKEYIVNRVKEISLGNDISVSLKEQTKKITADITPVISDKQLTNPTVIWTVSDSEIAEIQADTAPDSDNRKSSVILALKKEGEVTITAVTQDGSKKDTCKVKIVNAPVLKDAGKEIIKAVGETYKLEFKEQADLSKVKFESSNPDVVSVDGNGLLTMKKTGVSIIKASYDNGTFVQECVAVAAGEENLPEDKNYYIYEKKPGSQDDTKDISDLVEFAARKHDGFYLPAGVYNIDAEKKIWIWHINEGKQDKTFDFVMSPGALLRIKPTAAGDYSAIIIDGSYNVTVSGGTIIGERYEHLLPNDDSEGGEGISIYDSQNITIDNVDISNCWGDGIYLGTNYNTDDTNKNIRIINCNVHDNRRNNLSITVADGVTIDKCEFNRANGKDPQVGIDIEPNTQKNPCNNITISNSTFKKNKAASIAIVGVKGSVDKIRIENCTLDGNISIWKVSDSKNKITTQNIKFEGGAKIWEG